MSAIRKISTGPDYKNAMHFQVGQVVLGGAHTIQAIKRDPNSGDVAVFIKSNDDETIKIWKMISGSTPIHIEYNIDY